MDLKEKLKSLNINYSEAEYEDFILRSLKRLWNEYTKECMDESIIFKNKVEALPITIPNGTVGKDYKSSFLFPGELVDDYWIEGLNETGLNYSIGADGLCTIEGVPTKAGSFSLILSYKYKGWIEGKNILYRPFVIAINPDPKTLWKNIPTPTDIEYYQPDADSTYVKVKSISGNPQKDIVAASQRGRSHAHEGRPRDDHFRVEYLNSSGWYIITVADGAGSAKYSRKGSWLACDTSVDHCKAYFMDEKKLHDFEEYITTYKNESGGEYQKMMTDEIYKLVGNAAFKSYKAIEAEANTMGLPAKYYATTLLLAVCKRFSFGWFIASFWVGDGAMCIYDQKRQYIKMLGVPDEGEYSGQTRFLTMPEIFKDAASIYSRIRFSIERDFTALMLMTDGVSDPMFETDANLNKYEKWDALWKNIGNEVEMIDDNAESKNQLLKWLEFWSQGNHDDRTIAILY